MIPKAIRTFLSIKSKKSNLSTIDVSSSVDKVTTDKLLLAGSTWCFCTPTPHLCSEKCAKNCHGLDIGG